MVNLRGAGGHCHAEYSPWGNDDLDNYADASRYCRKVYEAGYAPICPTMYMSSFLGRDIPVEVKDKKDMSDELLKRSRILVVCGDHLNKDVRSDIALAKHCGISYTTLSGILDLAEIDDQP